MDSCTDIFPFSCFVLVFFFYCSELSSMEQSFLRVCLCVLRRFLYFGVRCCVCLTFPIEPSSSPLPLTGVELLESPWLWVKGTVATWSIALNCLVKFGVSG